MARVASPPRSNWKRAPVVGLIALAGAGIALVGGYVALTAIGVPTATESSPSATAPASPTAPAAAEGIEVDGLVTVAGVGLPVMEAPSFLVTGVGTLPPSQPAIVVAGPVNREGLNWYLLSGLGLPPNSGCEEPFSIADCPAWIGWAPASTGTAVLTALEQPACPDLSSYESFAVQTPIMQLVCARGRTVTLTAWWPGRSPFDTCIDSPPGVDWLYCARALGGWLAPSPDRVGQQAVGLAVDPASGVVLPEPDRWVEVTGHVDDPAAAACRVVPGAPDNERAAWDQVLRCRSTLVVESMVEVPAPD
ncbi:MAG TPA: hypothetical protein VFR14_10835 [Candidatus Limnocylindrales bacterium]|nr:hypothetical protein [Candidatus Limnocylindrales bacterium]